MIQRFALAAVALSPLLLSATLAAQTGRGAPIAPEVRHPAVDSLFRHLDRTRAPGAAVLVLREGQAVHRAGYGMANLEHGIPIRSGTVFDVASVSKQFAAWTIALLVEEGRISLDDDVRTHIPELPEFGEEITIRHLVHHTSGLRDWPGTLRLAGWDYEDVISFEQILRMAFAQRDLNFRPGDEYTYSNTGYNLLAEVVTRVTGTPFPQWIRRRLFEPLRMTSTHFHDDHRRIVPGRAESYRALPEGGFERAVSSLTAYGSSSLFTSIDDLELWLRNLDEPRVGGSRVVERMHTPGILNSGDTIAYAFGLVRGDHRGLEVLSHGGSWAGYRTHLLRYPDERLSVVVLGNRNDLAAAALARAVGEVFLGELMADVEEAGPSGAGTAAPSEEPFHASLELLREVAGVYRSPELLTEYRVELRGDRLVAWHLRHGERALAPVARDRFAAPGLGELTFLRDDGGRVVGLTVTAGVRNRDLHFERVEP